MYNLGDQFKFDLNKAMVNPECIVKGNSYRFSILSPSLIRLEYSANGIFNDLPTLKVWYRNFEKPNFNVTDENNILTITTDFFTLVYNKEKHFFGGKLNPSANLKVTSNITNKIWYYTCPEVRNYQAPAYMLSDTKHVRINSLFSIQGYVSLDDSDTDRFDEYGCLVKNDNKHIDIYLFMYGNKFLTCLKDYYNITGYPSLLPRYVFGNWWSRNITYTEEDITKMVEDFKENNIPLSVILLNDLIGIYLVFLKI